VLNWTEILTTLGQTAVVLGIGGWIGKSIFQTWLDRNLENHKSALERQSREELEHLRLSLRIEEMKQSRLLGRQARIIAAVYARLERLHQAMKELAAPVEHAGGNVERLKTTAIAEFESFSKYYFERGIWLDPETCDTINELQRKLNKLLVTFNFNVDAQGRIANRVIWLQSYQRLNESEIPNARTLLDKRFRRLLGVGEPPTTHLVELAAHLKG